MTEPKELNDNRIIPPPVSITEEEKFADGGKYFARTARYYAYYYYNTLQIPQSYQGFPPKTYVDETLDNYLFYYGFQNNDVFFSQTRTFTGGEVPAVWISGQKIRQLIDHIKGNVIEMVEPMGNNISANSISKHAVRKQKDILEKIQFASELNEILKDLPAPEIRFAPAGDIDYSNPKEVEKAKEKAREELEKTGVVLSRSLFFKNNLKEQFIDDASEQAIANLNMAEIKYRNGNIEIEPIAPYYAIYDFNSHSQFGDGQMFGGYVKPITFEQALAEYPDNEQLKNDIKKIQNYGSSQFNDWMNQYNLPYNNLMWWYPDKRHISKCVVYWIAESEIRMQVKKNAYGNKYLRKIDYTKNYKENGKEVKGYELRGDKKTWMVHYAVLIGNKYLVDYGYEPYQVRNSITPDKPQIPIITFCHEKKAGFVRSIVSRLKANQIEIDRLSHKIQELTANDLGRVFFIRGDKTNENLTPANIISDLKQFKITVIPPTGDEMSDSVKDIINGEDLSNNQYLMSYIALKKEQQAEMEAIVSIPPAALGMQRTIIGKGVQENTIAQSTRAMMSFYDGLMEYWRRKIQYAANKYKLILADNPGEYIMPLSYNEMEVVRITKEYRYEDLYVYIKLNDAIDQTNRMILNQMLQAYSQNTQNPLGAAQGLLNGIKLLRYNSFNEGIEQLEEFVEKLTREAKEQFEQQQIIQANQSQFEQQSALIQKQQEQIAELTKLITKINLEGAWSVKKEEVKKGLKEERDDAIIDNSLKAMQDRG